MADQDPFISQGFLADTRVLETKIRTAHAPWFALIDKVNSLAMVVQAVEMPRTGQGILIGTAYSRAVTLFQATVILSSKGLCGQALALVRSCAETAIAIGCARVNPEFGREIIEDHDRNRLALANDLLKTLDEGDNILPPQARQQLETFVTELQDQYVKPRPLRIKWAQAARSAEMIDLYNTVYRMTSAEGTHITVQSLDRHISTDAQGKATGFRLRPDVAGVSDALSKVIASIFNAMEAKLHGTGNEHLQDQVHLLVREWDALIQQESAHPG
jgi:hypothetical protein